MSGGGPALAVPAPEKGGGSARRARLRPYSAERLLLFTVMAVSLLGFWDVYLSSRANPQPHHHLHLITIFVWLALLLHQLNLVASARFPSHRRTGLLIFLAAPLLLASSTMLTVHSAASALAKGEPDALIVQNVMTTFFFGLLVTLAFALRRRRKLHGALLMSSSILFLGIALFFALIGFAPPLRIEGPETFYRFQQAAILGQALCIAVGLGFFLKDRRNNWPYLLAGLSFLFNEALRSGLSASGLIDSLTRLVAGPGEGWAFAGGFLVMLALIWLTGVRPAAMRR